VDEFRVDKWMNCVP